MSAMEKQDEKSEQSIPSQDPVSGSSSTHTTGDEESSNNPPAFNPGTSFYLAFLALAVMTLMVALDGTTLSVALPVIARKLNGSALEAFWSGTSFLLASTVFQPTIAQFSHIFGRVRLVMISITLFMIGVLVSALAKNFTYMLVGRSIQGVGGGGILVLTEILVTDLVPLRYRGQWAGIIGGMWALGSVTGPVIGGAFAQSNWRWIFWLNLPFIGFSYILIPMFLKLNVLSSTLSEKLRRIDWTGSALFVGSTTSFLIPITWGGVQYPWSSWRVLVPLLIGAAGIIGFFFYERMVAKEPILPTTLFNNRTITVGYVTAVIHGTILWCLLYYQPLYFQAVQGYSPILSGVAMFPSSFTVAPMAVITGLIVAKTGRYRWSIWTGWAFACLGMGVMITWQVDSSIPHWLFTQLVAGIGLGTLFSAMLFQIQAAARPEDIAFAAAFFSFFRAFGQSVGVAIGGVIFQNQMQKNLLKTAEFATQATELAEDAAALVEVIKMTEDGPKKLVLQTAYTDSIHTIYIVMCALAGVALLLSLSAKHYDLNMGLETQQGLVTQKKKTNRAEQAA